MHEPTQVHLVAALHRRVRGALAEVTQVPGLSCASVLPQAISQMHASGGWSLGSPRTVCCPQPAAVTASHVPPARMHTQACGRCLSPGARPHATQTAARMTGGRPCIGAPLHADDTTLRHHTLMVEEPCHGAYPHPQ